MSNYSDFFPISGGTPESGELLFEIPGTYEWTVPAGIDSICCVCIGAGEGGGVGDSYIVYGGAGGGLGYTNSIAVSEGSILTIVVGKGGNGDHRASVPGGYKGGDSSVTLGSTLKCAGYGGDDDGGTYLGDGGGDGGDGDGFNYSQNACAGGGGAGGYSGRGGHGRKTDSYNYSGYDPLSGSGAAAGGGASLSAGSWYYGGVGGGTSPYGKGDDGEGQSGNDATNSRHGSNLIYPNATMADWDNFSVGIYGGGGAAVAIGSTTDQIATPGSHGVVRILWGEGRSFPSTDVGLTAGNPEKIA